MLGMTTFSDVMLASVAFLGYKVNAVSFAIVCLAFWFASFLHISTRQGKRAFSRYFPLHDFHCAVYVIFGLFSIYYDDESYFSEHIPIIYASSYFAVDLVDCYTTGDIAFLVHAILSLGLNIGCAFSPIHMSLRSVSKGALIEISTPFLHKWHTSKKKSDFKLFLALFTAARIIWFPYFLWGTFYVHDAPKNGFIFPLCAILLMLQTFWWFKLWGMLFNYKDRPAKKDV